MSNLRKPSLEESFGIRPKQPGNYTEINWKNMAAYAAATFFVAGAVSFVIYKVMAKNNEQWMLNADQNAQEHLDAIVNKEKRITLLEEQLRQEKVRNVSQVASPTGPTSFMRIASDVTKSPDYKGAIDQNTNISDIE
jgi:hypothetical protein